MGCKLTFLVLTPSPDAYIFQNVKEARTVIEICKKYKSERREYRSDPLIFLHVKWILTSLDQSLLLMMDSEV